MGEGSKEAREISEEIFSCIDGGVVKYWDIEGMTRLSPVKYKTCPNNYSSVNFRVDFVLRQNLVNSTVRIRSLSLTPR
jgi:hypothetical protein